MEYEAIKQRLADSSSESGDSFSLLKEIARKVNRPETHDQGRDLVIRALAVVERFEATQRAVLYSLTRTVGLFPYLSDHLKESDPDDLLAYELHRCEMLGEDIVFHSLQARIFNYLIAGSNVVLSAHTSVGKSLVIDALVASEKFKKLVIVVPTLALIDEIRRRLGRRFSGRCALITHQTQSAIKDKLNIYILTQERVLQRDDLADTQLFVIDEFYKVNLGISDTDRAVDLSLAFHKLVTTGAQFYLLGPNIQAVDGLAAYEYHFIPSLFSTVAVDIVQYNLPKGGDERNERLAELCKTLDGSTIIYCQSPPSASKTAGWLASTLPPIKDQAILDAAQWIAENYSDQWVVYQALLKGIAIHHAGIPRSLQQFFVRMFNAGRLKVLVCTSTIIEGVNTVAKNVIIYDRRRSNRVLDHFTYRNIAGRAGRMNQHFIGRVFVLEMPPDEEQFAVEFPIGHQDADTPLSLLLPLDQDALTEASKKRLQDVFQRSSLSEATLRKNRYVSVESQEALAQVIRGRVIAIHNQMVWRGVPSGPQLKLLCNLIYDHLDGELLPDYRIFSGHQLAFILDELRINIRKGLYNYLQLRIRDAGDALSPSEAIENAMKFLRNIVCQRLPRSVMVVSAIQEEVLGGLGYKYGDYALFAAQLEHCFSHPLLFALEEYGVPLQTALALAGELIPADDLDSVLRRLKQLNPRSFGLSKFEVDVLSDAQQYIQ